MNICTERELIDHFAFPWILRCLLVVGIQARWCAGTVFHRPIVYSRSTFRHGLLNRQHRLQNFILYMNQILRLLGGFLRLRNDPRDPVADMADLPVKQPPVMRRRLRIALPGLHVVDIRTVSRRDDLHNARYFFRLSGVNRFDVGTGIRRPQNNQDTGIRRDIVLDIRPLTADERRTVHLAVRRPDLSELLAEDRCCFGLIVTKLSSLPNQLNRKEVMLVRCIPDENPGKRILDLFLRRIRVILQQPCQKQSRRRCIVGALHNPCIDHRLLYVRQMFGVTKPVRCQDVAAISLPCKIQIRIDRCPVNQNRITSAEPLGIVRVADADMPRRNQQLPQTHHRIYIKGSRYMVDHTGYLHASVSPFLPPVLWPDEILSFRRRYRFSRVTPSRYRL